MIPLAKPLLGEKEKKLVADVLDSGMLAQGPRVKEFEDRFTQFSGTSYAVALNSGTAALHAALSIAGVKPGDEVITVPFTFVATASPILMQGAIPVFVDVTRDTFAIDSALIREKITSRTKAIIAVDLYGQIFDYSPVRALADAYGLVLIEDACQAVHASLDGKKAGSFGDLAAFSFYATKNIMTGEGGMLTTNNPHFVELAKRFRHHGQSEQTRYEYHSLGYNYRMTDIQAAIGLGQLDNLDSFTQKRIYHASLLTEGLYDTPGIHVPFVKPSAVHVYHQYTLIVDGFRLTRDQLLVHLKEQGIGAGIYYPKPLHLHPVFTQFGYTQGDFPVAEYLSHHVLSLPCHPSLTQEDIQYIIDAIRKVS